MSKSAKPKTAAVAPKPRILQSLFVHDLAPYLDHVEPMHRLIGGARRWRAVGLLLADGRWDPNDGLPCNVLCADGSTRFELIPHDRIAEDHENARQDFDPEALAELAESLVAAGEAEHATLALIENLQRKDLKPLEEARALKQAMEASGVGTDELARKVGKSQRWVQIRLQLLNLPPIKLAEMEAGKLTVDGAKQWFANQPKVVDLADADWLLLLELYDKQRREPENPRSPSETTVNLPAEEDFVRASRLKDASGYAMITGPSRAYEGGQANGLFKAGVTAYSGLPQLRLKFGDLDDQALRDVALRKARAAAGVDCPLAFEPGEYVTPWLCGPFVPDAGVVEEARKARAAEAVSSARAAVARADQDRRRAEATARSRLLASVEPTAWSAAEVEDLVEAVTGDLDLPLPWRPDHFGMVLAANGSRAVDVGMVYANREELIARALVICAAVNGAAGLATPPMEDHAAREVEREDGVDEVTGDGSGEALPDLVEGGPARCSACWCGVDGCESCAATRDELAEREVAA